MQYKLILFLLLCSLVFDGGCQQVPSKIARQIDSFFVPFNLSANGIDSLPVLSELVKGKTIVAIGEATHGTHEYDAAFNRITQHLIQYDNFNVIFLAEYNFANTRALNDYVVWGKGDAYYSLKYKNYYPDSEVENELVDLADHVQGFNKGKPLEERVWMLGGDILLPQQHARDALSFCRRNNLKLPKETFNILSELANLPFKVYTSYLKRNPLSETLKKIAPLYQLIKTQDTTSLTFNEQWEYQSIMSLMKAIKTFYVLYSDNTQMPRDSAMYEHIKWVKAFRPDAKIIIKAHNEHVEKQGVYWKPNKVRLGGFLNEFYRDEYFAIATDECKGSFWASSVGRSVSIPEHKAKLGNIVEKIVDAPAGLLNVNATSDLTRFFNKKHRLTRATTTPNSQAHLIKGFAKAFDALFYLRISTPGKLMSDSLPIYKFRVALEIPQQTLKKNELKISLLSSFKLRKSSLPGEGVNISLIFYDENWDFVGFRALNIFSGDAISHSFHVPERAYNCLLGIPGRNVEEFSLMDLEVNEVKIDMNDLFVYNANELQDASGKERIYVETSDKNRLTIKVRNEYAR